MQEWFASGGNLATAVIWTIAAMVLLVIVLFVVRLLRGGTRFAGHGREHRPRLTIGDAIAVDNQRRLVLVRRDDVEHLILTGGPNDLVVEQNIRLHAPARPQPLDAPPARQQPAVPAPPPAAAPVVEAAAPRSEPRQPAPRPEAPASRPEPQPAEPPVRLHPAAPAPQQASAPGPHGGGADPVLEEMGADMEAPAPAAGQPVRRSASLEDEMSRLLEDISDERR